MIGEINIAINDGEDVFIARQQINDIITLVWSI